jgi:DNA-directed RNA polymerase specialized sigma24 family protein
LIVHSWNKTLLHNSSEYFLSRITRLRTQDPNAIKEFVAEYEPFIRRTLRFRIARAALKSAADSVDVCNSVMGSFLIRLAAGSYKIETEEDLRKLLGAIANKKFLMLNRREQAEKRARSQTRSINEMPELAAENLHHPSEQIEIEELSVEINKRLSHEERLLLDRRRNGLSWMKIAEEFGEDTQLLRKRLSRAIQRVAEELGLD